MIAIPCNVAHIYFDSIIPDDTFNMINEVCKRLDNSTSKVTVLTTHPTIESSLYQAKLQARAIP